MPMTTIPPYPRPKKRHIGHQCAKHQKHPKQENRPKNHSHNDIPEKNHQITHKTSSKSKESVIVHQITHKTSIQSKESAIVHHITHKTTLRSKISVINHRITHKKTFPSNQTTIEITHRGIHESQPISDTRGLIPVSCHTHRPTTMSDMTTIFARPQKRKSKISTPAVRYPRHRKKTHGH